MIVKFICVTPLFAAILTGAGPYFIFDDLDYGLAILFSVLCICNSCAIVANSISLIEKILL